MVATISLHFVTWELALFHTYRLGSSLIWPGYDLEKQLLYKPLNK